VNAAAVELKVAWSFNAEFPVPFCDGKDKESDADFAVLPVLDEADTSAAPITC
jgi:hypothetical protein